MFNVGRHFKVEGVDAKPFEHKETKQPIKPEKSAELQEAEARAQKFINDYRPFLTTYARDTSLRYKFGDSFYIDLENGEVNFAAKWYLEQGYTQNQMLWATLHELTHFRDLAEDPKRMMENFEYINQWAKITGEVILKKYEDKFGQSHPEVVEAIKTQHPISRKHPEKTMNAAEQSAYKMHHTFYNVFDDIWDNSTVARRAPRFEQWTSGGREVTELYSKKLFKQKDYAKIPRHLQFLYALLRDEMVPGEESAVSGEVTAALSKTFRYQGVNYYGAKNFVDEVIKPRGSRNTSAGNRYMALQAVLEPVYLELLSKDIQEWDPVLPQQQSGGGGGGQENNESGDSSDAVPQSQNSNGNKSPSEANAQPPQMPEVNPFAKDYKDYDQANPDRFNPEDIADYLEAKQKGTINSTPEDEQGRAENNQQIMDEDWRNKNEIDEESFQKLQFIEGEVAPYLNDLSSLWKYIIFGSTSEISRSIGGRFQTGVTLNMPAVIEEWPKISQGRFDTARTMNRIMETKIKVSKPELIRVRLVGDLSGSMQSRKTENGWVTDHDKLHVLQQCMVLLLSSLDEFENYLNITRARTKSKMHADTQAWTFGSTVRELKGFSQPGLKRDARADMTKMLAYLSEDMNFTYDNLVLGKIAESITPEDSAKIAQEKILDIVIEITDGGSSDPQLSKEAIKKLEDLGVVVFAFQIGVPSPEEKNTFNEVWNSNKEKPKGKIVGKDLAKLLPAMVALLKEFLKGVKV